MTEITLDPDNWDNFRKLTHQSVDLIIDYLIDKPKGKVWQSVPEEVKRNFRISLPKTPTSQEEVVEEFRKLILPYALGNIHPRSWGWVMGNGTPFQLLASLFVAGMNTINGAFEQSSTYVELQIIEWMKELFSFPKESFGLILTGGSMANYVALSAARYDKLPFDVRENGIQQSEKYFTIYVSNESHFSIVSAIESLGFGNKALRKIQTNKDFTINIEDLQNKIAKDRANGYVPTILIGMAGTVNTGSIDDLDTLAEIAENENLWFHVDGAFGALLMLSEKHKEKLKGIKKADSIAFDFHKWMHVNYEGAMTLVKKGDILKNTYVQHAHYTATFDRGIMATETFTSDYGPELSREFKALKIWMSIKEHGITKFGKLIDQNLEQAQYVASLVNKHENLELMAPVCMQIVCFRYINPRVKEETLNKLNNEIMLRLQEKGLAIISSTVLHEKFVLRVNITNHRSKFSDFDFLIYKILELGSKIIEEFQNNSKFHA